MIKIAFTTLSYNYGSLLQCYATKELFEMHGAKCDYFNYFLHLPKWYKLISKRSQKNKHYDPEPYFLDKKFLKLKRDFINSVILPRHYNYRTLKELSSYYDHFVIGSDQVWNFNQGMSFLPLLPFAKKNQCSSLSSSFGNNTLGCSNRVLKKALKRFRFLSVREESGAKMIKKIVGRDAIVLPDPVVALTREEWRRFYSSKTSCDKMGEYVLIHFLNKPSEHSLELIKNKLAINKTKVICFFGNYGYFDGINNIVYLDGSPFDYLSLIDNAKLVLTDSFHTAQFSIIFGKKFHIFERDYGRTIPQNDRIKELIKKFDVGDSYVDKDVNYLDETHIVDESYLLHWRKTLHDYVVNLLNEVEQKERIANSYECCNCGSCYNSCPMKAIYTTKCPRIFEHKVINSAKCCKCNLCSEKCFLRPGISNRFNKLAYYGFSNDSEIRKSSASGGVFASLARQVLDNGGVVYGAVLQFNNNKAECKTICVDNINDLHKILNSKYVECDIEYCMKEIKNRLDSGQTVLVGSTSCKINGLLNFLNKKYKNLITVDFVCHGVPSIIFFNKYLKYLEKKYKARIIDYSFKKKPANSTNVEWFDFYSETITFKRKKETFSKTIPYKDSWFLKKYASGQIYRDNCYFCEYSDINKPSDITLGDYFELKNDYPDNEDADQLICNGVNAIIVNTQKGKDLLLENNYLISKECSLNKIVDSHYNLKRSFDYNYFNAKMRKFVSSFGFSAYFKARRVYDIVYRKK